MRLRLAARGGVLGEDLAEDRAAEGGERELDAEGLEVVERVVGDDVAPAAVVGVGDDDDGVDEGVEGVAERREIEEERRRRPPRLGPLAAGPPPVRVCLLYTSPSPRD